MPFTAGDTGHIAEHNRLLGFGVAWTSYGANPTAGAPFTTSTNDGGYEVVGKRITGEHYYVFTGGGTAGNLVSVQIPPFTPKRAYANRGVGSFTINDSGNSYAGSVRLDAVGGVFYFVVGGGPTSAFGIAPAILLGAADTLGFCYTYEIA